MNTTHDKVRAALQDTAAEITRDSIGPMPLTEPPGYRAAAPGHREPATGSPRRRATQRPSWQRPLVPLAAAAAVIAVIAGVVTAANRSHAPATASQAESAAQVLAQLPPYSMTVNKAIRPPGTDRGSPAVLRSTSTGDPIATFPPTKGYSFADITGSASGREFALAEQRTRFSGPRHNISLYQLDIVRAAADGVSPVAPLAALTVPAGWVSGLALSADGSRLAVAVSGYSGESQLRIYSVATGAVQVWQAHGVLGRYLFGVSPITWAAGGQALAVDLSDSADLPASGLRLLNTADPSGSLLADSRLLVSNGSPPPGYSLSQGLLTPDGTKVVALLENDPPHGGRTGELVEFAAATGHRLRVIYRERPAFAITPAPLWTSPSGQLVVMYVAAGPSSVQVIYHVLHDGHLTPLPWLTALQPFALAF